MATTTKTRTTTTKKVKDDYEDDNEDGENDDVDDNYFYDKDVNDNYVDCDDEDYDVDDGDNHDYNLRSKKIRPKAKYKVALTISSNCCQNFTRFRHSKAAQIEKITPYGHPESRLKGLQFWFVWYSRQMSEASISNSTLFPTVKLNISAFTDG